MATRADKNSTQVMAVYKGVPYWFDFSTLWRAEPGNQKPIQTAKGPRNVWGLIIDDTGIYWTDKVDGSDDGEVRRIPFVAGAEVAVVGSGLTRPWGIALDDRWVYWADNADRSGTIMRALKRGGPPQIIASNQDAPVDVGVDGKAIYWTNAGSKTVMRLKR